MFKAINTLWKKMMTETPVSKEKTLSMSAAELIKEATSIHPVGFYVLASKLFKDGKKDESIFWFYVGSIRYRYFLSLIGESPFHPENELFGKVQFEVGGMVLDYAGGDPDFWAKQVGEASKWDHDNLNSFFPKKNDPEALMEIKKNVEKLRLTLLEEKESIIRQRIENKAEVRV
jgi:hypothetical protein